MKAFCCLAAGGRARLFFAKICRNGSFWRQDGVIDASLGVVHASLHTSHTRKTAGGFWLLASVLQAARCRSSRVTFSGAALALHGEKRDDSNANVLYYSQRECCGRRNDAVIDF